MPAAEFELRVLEFNDYIKTHRPCRYELISLRQAKVAGQPVLKMSDSRYQKPEEMGKETNIQIHSANYVNLTLKFRITDSAGNEGTYYPVGLALNRADGTRPAGAPASAKRTHPSPFSMLKLNPTLGRFEFLVEKLNVPPHDPANVNRTHTTYQYTVFFQHLETGAIGVIDPQIENPM